MAHINPSIFKAYDVRGIYPSEINKETVEKIGNAYVNKFDPKIVIVGADVRESSPELKTSLIKGLTSQGTDVIDIGTVSTDMMYFAVTCLKTDGGLIISASHNPREYNGIKMVRAGSEPISSTSGLFDLRDMILSEEVFATKQKIGKVFEQNIMPEYLEMLRSYIDHAKLKPMKVVANGNFGMAGTVAEMLFRNTPIELIFLNEKPDGTFPKGRPDPLRPENRDETIALIQKTGADFGVAWDADADRCFFYDENGAFIEGYFTTAILASILLRKNPGNVVVYDTRLIWANKKAVEEAGGRPIENRAGHAFIKERMRKENAVFGGEMSGHYYFRDNNFADNGMIPFLLMLNELSQNGKKMSELADPLRNTFFTPGEINFTVKNPQNNVQDLKMKFMQLNEGKITEIDGVSVEFKEWRFNVRASNTEPLLRLNIEALSKETLEKNLAEITKLIEQVA